MATFGAADGQPRDARSQVDNATHALIGLLVAEAAISAREASAGPSTKWFRVSARVTSVFANNVPDLDFLYARQLGKKLGYLLHHRGYSHTLLIGIAAGLATFVVWSLAARRHEPLSRGERLLILGLCSLGPLVHIGFDALNNYGVHPFWPFDNRWYYGDTLFIVEPWLWVLAVPTLARRVESRVSGGVLYVLLALVLVLAFVLTMVPLGVALALTLASVAVWAAQRRIASGSAVWLSLASVAALLVLFATGSSSARTLVTRELEQRLARAQTGEAVRAVAITPAPGNPLCFSALSVTTAGDTYVVRSAHVSLSPGLISPAGCRLQPTGQTVGLDASDFAKSAHVQWRGVFRGSIRELAALAHARCEAAALMRFARVPFWKPTAADRVFIGDLRFDHASDLDFDELALDLSAPPRCPRWVPPWRPPRADVF